VRFHQLNDRAIAHVVVHSGDDDGERRTQGEVLLNAYNRELERRRLAAGARGVAFADEGWPYLCHWSSMYER
jgi:hypothetical protein